MLARGAGTKVRTSDQNGSVFVGLSVQNKVRIVVAPVGKQSVFEAGAGDALEVDRWDDLVGVHVGSLQWNANAGVGGKFFHSFSSLP